MDLKTLFWVENHYFKNYGKQPSPSSSRSSTPPPPNEEVPQVHVKKVQGGWTPTEPRSWSYESRKKLLGIVKYKTRSSYYNVTTRLVDLVGLC